MHLVGQLIIITTYHQLGIAFKNWPERSPRRHRPIEKSASVVIIKSINRQKLREFSMSNAVHNIAQQYVDDEKFSGIEWTIETAGQTHTSGACGYAVRHSRQRFHRRLFIVFIQ